MGKDIRQEAFNYLTVLCALRGLPSKNHFGVINEITVDGKAVVVLAEVNPVGFNLGRTVTLLQENNIGHNLCSCVRLESVIR